MVPVAGWRLAEPGALAACVVRGALQRPCGAHASRLRGHRVAAPTAVSKACGMGPTAVSMGRGRGPVCSLHRRAVCGLPRRATTVDRPCGRL